MPYTSLAAAAFATTVAALLGAAPGVAAQDADAAAHHLTITVTGTENADGTHELRCDPVGGDHPDGAAACDVLTQATDDDKNLFTPVADDAICTFLHGGPATATIEGRWAGEPVKADFNRVNGCEVDRWNKLVPVLPQP